MKLLLKPSVVCGLLVGQLAWPAAAALQSGTYQTPPGTMAEERGDRVPGGIRQIPLSAKLTLDLNANPPSVTAVLSNAVLEGGEPFKLTVRSSSGGRLSDGTYQFSGDYLQDLYPAGTQYAFDWKFSQSNSGPATWEGAIFWTGGHIWQITLPNTPLQMQAPQPSLQIARQGAGSAEVTWPSQFTDYVLEYNAELPAGEWKAVPTAPVTVGDRLSVTVPTDASSRFYRLRKP